MGLMSVAPVELLLTGRFAGFTRADLICAGDHVGWSWLSSAAAPAMCGVAMLVPWKNAKHGGEAQEELVTEESTLTPGAVASGLIWNVKGVGPRLEKPAMMSALGPSVKNSCGDVPSTDAVPEAPIAAPFTFDTITAGMVG
jgi:hypothetical protein